MSAKVLVYSKDPCPYCVAAKKFLTAREIPFDEIDLTGQSEEMQKMKDQTGWSTFPIILIGGKVIGGFNDLRALEQEGKLDRLLAD